MSFWGSIKKLDWLILFAFFIFVFFSLSFLYFYDFSFFKKQAFWYLLAFLIIIVFSQINWNWVLNQKNFLYGIYFLNLILLLISNFQSSKVRGTKSWIYLGGINFEPVEFTKLVLILVLSVFFAKRYLISWQFKNLLISFLIFFVPGFLVFIHPDLGSVAILFAIWVSFLFFGGIYKKRFFIGFLIFLILCYLAWNFVLKDYQKNRFLGFLFPEKDPLGINYNLNQAKIAIGSGGFWGKGLGQGAIAQFRFLPEAHNDFIFAALLEQWGFLGGIILILTYVFVFYRILTIGKKATNNTFKFLVLGSVVYIFLQTFINMSTNIGLLPVTGVTLPFVSYGGSSLLTIASVIGIIQHIKISS